MIKVCIGQRGDQKEELGKSTSETERDSCEASGGEPVCLLTLNNLGDHQIDMA